MNKVKVIREGSLAELKANQLKIGRRIVWDAKNQTCDICYGLLDPIEGVVGELYMTAKIDSHTGTPFFEQLDECREVLQEATHLFNKYMTTRLDDPFISISSVTEEEFYSFIVNEI